MTYRYNNQLHTIPGSKQWVVDWLIKPYNIVRLYLATCLTSKVTTFYICWYSVQSINYTTCHVCMESGDIPTWRGPQVVNLVQLGLRHELLA